MKYVLVIILLINILILTIETSKIKNSHKHKARDKGRSLGNYQRIINGRPAQKSQFPYQARLRCSAGNFCGGALISPSWILTAAHCCYGCRYWDIKLGGIWFDDDESGQIVMRSNKGFMHPNHNKRTKSNDIALISLPQQVRYSGCVQPIRLATAAYTGFSMVNSRVISSGWGATGSSSRSDRLMFVNLVVISNSECARLYGSSVMTSNKLCVTGHSFQSVCFGDSGGPLTYIDKQGRPTLVGLVSFVSQQGCEKELPQVFTHVAYFLNWIQGITGIRI